MSDAIQSLGPSKLIWKLVSIDYILVYVEYGTFLIMLFSMYIAVFYSIRVYLRSVARSLVLNFFRDYPDEIMDAYASSDMSGEVGRLLAQVTANSGVTNNVDQSALSATIVIAAEKKIRRNLHKFNDFGGPIYPSYKLSDADIIHYHYILEKLKEPRFLYKVRDAIAKTMTRDPRKLRYSGVLPIIGGDARLSKIINDSGVDFIYLIIRRLLNLWN